MKQLLDMAFPGNVTVSRIRGGDINESFLVRYSGQEFFVKYNSAAIAIDMFKAEQKGLESIEAAVPGSTPKTIKIVSDDNGAILLMEYIRPSNGDGTSQNTLGDMVGLLHKQSSENFGLVYHNYIGTLMQPRCRYSDFTSFYLFGRLIPQVRMAIDKDLLNHAYISKIEKLETVLKNEVPEESPSLIHGDLWGGNYMMGENGKYYLIDPAISYAHREMDIGMTLLFGGYNESFYSSYQNTFPLTKGWKKRTTLFQLYYLLVHLNLFGSSYKGAVDNILHKWLKQTT